MTGDLFPEVHKPKAPEAINRRYTTRPFMEWIKRKAGVDGWDLDAAADSESHWAPRWFCAPGDEIRADLGCAGVDAFKQAWAPTPEWFEVNRVPQGLGVVRIRPVLSEWGFTPPVWRVFLNPPFDNLGDWLGLVWRQLGAAQLLMQSPKFCFRVAMVMPANRPEQPLWQEHVEPFRDGRAMRYGYRLETHYPPGRQVYGHPGCPEGAGSADFPSMCLVWRSV